MPRHHRILYGAIDIGTSTIKCSALDPSEPDLMVRIGEAEGIVLRPSAGAAEIDPAETFAHCLDLLRRLFTEARRRDAVVPRIALSGHISSILCADQNGRTFPPCPIWQDQRCHREADDFFTTFGSRLDRVLGVRVRKGTNWPAPKLRWLRRTHPDALARAWKVFQVKDYVFHRLTGRAWSDPASWLGLTHLIKGTLHPDIAAWCGISADVLPDIRRPTDAAPLLPEWTDRITCRQASPPALVVGTADMASAFTALSPRPGEGILLANTAELIGVAVDRAARFRTPRQVVRYPISPERDLVYGVTANGGASLHWLRGATGGADIDTLTREAQATPPGAGDLLFLPYLSGERAPLWNPDLTGAFLGLRTTHERGHLARAVFEGCALSKRHVLAASGTDLAPEAHFTVCGGSSVNAFWNRIRANVLNRPLTVMPDVDASILGALFLAAETDHPDLPARCRSALQQHTVCPDPEEAALYDRIYSRYEAAVRRHTRIR